MIYPMAFYLQEKHGHGHNLLTTFIVLAEGDIL
jgi:hypothetical protein